jgi:hypothetical protein
MSRTYRRYFYSFFRNVHHRNRLLKEKNHHDSSVRSIDDYTELTKQQIAGIVIESNAIPPDSYDDLPISGAREIYTPSPAQINNISRTARRFMKHHKCTYKDFTGACAGRNDGFDLQESLKKDAILVIRSD